MSVHTPQHDDAVRLHARHTLYVMLMLVALITTFFIVISKQYNLDVDHEQNVLINNFKEQVSEIDNFLAGVTTRVEGLRIQAESELLESRHSTGINFPLLYKYLHNADGNSRFHLDNCQVPVTRKSIGNLTGEGSLTFRDHDFNREICMALELNPQFLAVSSAIADAAWVYYTSARNFINIYPWVPSSKFRFSRELFTHEFYTRGTPGYNPLRSLFWTDVYIDEYGKGLMTTCAAPVYDKNRFVGTVAIDLTVDFFNDTVKKFRSGKGIMILVNDRKQVLAHPSLVTSSDKKPKTFREAIPESLRNAATLIEKLSTNRVVPVNGHNVLRATLSHAPWQVYYLEAQSSVWAVFADNIGFGAVMLIAVLLLLVISIMLTTHWKFVVPSGKLVNFIMAQSKGDAASSDCQKVPAIWKPWFTAIENIFAENKRLTQKTRDQNEELEKRVAERTARLAESNAKLQIEIEERQQAEEEKQKLQIQLQRAQKMEAIGTLAGGVAHDLNNVLSGLVSYPELLLMDLEPDSPLRNPIVTIKKSGERAAAIVQDLLTLARRGVAVTEVVNLNDLVSEYLSSSEFKNLQSYYPAMKVTGDLEEELLNIAGSPVHLSKCIMNLMTNAAEAMTQGGIITISTENRYIDQPISGYDDVEEGDYVTLTVSDSGMGISPEDIDRIFEPFYTKKVMGRSGTGLGMAVVWGAVKDHHGYIDLRSIPGQETTVTLFFPVTRENASEKFTSINLDDCTGKGEFILVIDDIAEQREIAVKMLGKLGYEAKALSSGEEAVVLMRDHSPDLIILDMIMDPGMDGLETYQKICAIRPGQKAIIASGFSETDRVQETQRLGAGGYLKKPFLIEKLAVAVKKELER